MAAKRRFFGGAKDRRRGCKRWYDRYTPREGTAVETAAQAGPDEPLSPDAKARRDEARKLLALRTRLEAVEAGQTQHGGSGQDAGLIALYSAPWWRHLGIPPVCGAGDHVQARAYAAHVERVLDRDWPARMRGNMERVLRDWRARAEGLDPVFEVAGFDPDPARRAKLMARAGVAKRKRQVLQARARGSMPEV